MGRCKQGTCVTRGAHGRPAHRLRGSPRPPARPARCSSKRGVPPRPQVTRAARLQARDRAMKLVGGIRQWAAGRTASGGLAALTVDPRPPPGAHLLWSRSCLPCIPSTPRSGGLAVVRRTPPFVCHSRPAGSSLASVRRSWVSRASCACLDSVELLPRLVRAANHQRSRAVGHLCPRAPSCDRPASQHQVWNSLVVSAGAARRGTRSAARACGGRPARGWALPNQGR